MEGSGISLLRRVVACFLYVVCLRDWGFEVVVKGEDAY